MAAGSGAHVRRLHGAARPAAERRLARRNETAED